MQRLCNQSPTLRWPKRLLLHFRSAPARHTRDSSMRIAIGGFQHETNTFAPSKASFDDFLRGRSWPPLARGEEIFERSEGMNVPIAGFIERMRKSIHQLVPTAWAGTTPSAHVTRDAFERIAEMIIAPLRSAR